MIDITDYTMKQLLLACGKVRGVRRTNLIKMIKLSNGYVTKMDNDKKFLDLLKAFQLLEPDEDTKEMQGLSTLLKDVARLIYRLGEKND